RQSAATRALKPRERYAENCGIAIAARMPMIATTTSNSINVKPLDRLRPAFCILMDSPLSGARWAAPGAFWGILPRPRRPAAQAPDSPHISHRHAGRAGGIRWTLGACPRRLGIAVELAVERLAVEDLCGPRPVPADRLHHAQDVAPLDLLQRDQLLGVVARDHHVRGAVGADALRQVVHPDALAGGQRHRALHAVLQ